MEPDNFPFEVIRRKPRKVLSVVLLSAVCVGSAVLFGFGLELLDRWNSGVAVLIFMAGMVTSLYLADRLFRLSRKMRFTDPVSQLSKDNRSPVLFLRAFDDDDWIDLTSRTFNSRFLGRYEDTLAKTLNPIGPLVALGRPNEQWPQTGAVRFYVHDKEWQAAVHYFIKHAAAAVLVIGPSPALRWELAEVLKTMPLGNILFFFPYTALKQNTNLFVKGWNRVRLSKKIKKQMDTERQHRYTVFKKDVEAILGRPFPESLGDTVFIDFEPEGQPRFLAPVRPSLFDTIAQVSGANRHVGIHFNKTLLPFLTKYTAKHLASA